METPKRAGVQQTAPSHCRRARTSNKFCQFFVVGLFSPRHVVVGATRKATRWARAPGKLRDVSAGACSCSVGRSNNGHVAGAAPVRDRLQCGRPGKNPATRSGGGGLRRAGDDRGLEDSAAGLRQLALGRPAGQASAGTVQLVAAAGAGSSSRSHHSRSSRSKQARSRTRASTPTTRAGDRPRDDQARGRAAPLRRGRRSARARVRRWRSVLKVPKLAATQAATHTSEAKPFAHGFPLCPKRSALVARVPRRGCGGALVPAYGHRFQRPLWSPLWPSAPYGHPSAIQATAPAAG